MLKYHYSNPHWEKRRSQVVAHEQSSLYGLLINPDKKVSFGRIDAVAAKEIFIRSALVQGDFESRAKFFRKNRALINELETHEAKSRRHDIIVDEQVLYEFYEQRIPDGIHSGAGLDKWLRDNPEVEQALYLTEQDLIREDASLVCDTQFPDALEMSGSFFPLEYHFDPRNHCDGVTLITPASGLDAINAQRCEWLIPGLLQEKMTALIRSLPKQLRKNFVPAPNYADACLEALSPGDTALTAAMSNHLKKMSGVLVPYDAWNSKEIDAHLMMNFRVVAGDGKVLEQGRSLQAIKDKLSGRIDKSVAVKRDVRFNRDDVGVEAIAEVSRCSDGVLLDMQGASIKMYPALLSEGKTVNLRVLESRANALSATHEALRQLIVNALPEQVKHVRSSVSSAKNLCLKYSDFGRCETLIDSIVNNVIDEVFLTGPIEDADTFEASVQKGKSELHEISMQWVDLVSGVLDAYREVKKLLKKPALSQLDVVADIQSQLNYLFSDNFVSLVDKQWLQEYPRYLSAIQKRFEKSRSNATRDRQLRLDFMKLWDEYIKRKGTLEKQHIDSPQLDYYRWMLEEYRVSLFAQELRTKFPVSEKRLKKYWDELSV